MLKKQQKAKVKTASAARGRYLDKTAEIFFIVIMAVFPLYLNGEKYVGMTSHKAKFFWVVCGLAVLALIVFWLTHWGPPPKLRQIRLSVADGAILALWVCVTISAVLSPHQNLVWFGEDQRNSGWLTTTCYTAAYFIISRLYVPRQRDVRIFTISSGILSLIGILQFYGWDLFQLFPYESFMGPDVLPQYSSFTIYFRATLGTVDVVSAYVSMTLIFFGICYVKERSLWRYAYLCAGILNFLLMIIAGADSGKVAVTAVMVLMLPYWLSDRKTLGRAITLVSGWGIAYSLYYMTLQSLKARRLAQLLASSDLPFFEGVSERSFWPWLLICVVLALLGAGLSAFGHRVPLRFSVRAARITGVSALVLMLVLGVVSVEILGARYENQPQHILYQAREALHGNLDDDFGTGRVFVWRSSLSAASEHLWWGTGPDTFDKAFEPFQAETQLRYNLRFDKAHNDYIQILVCCGILALIAYLALLAGAFTPHLIRAFDDPLLLAAIGAGLSYCIQSFFGVDVPIASPLFWMILGLTGSLARLDSPLRRG
jgi:hypothetical protein